MNTPIPTYPEQGSIEGRGEDWPVLPDTFPERKVILDRALNILRGLRARNEDRARTLASETLGY